MPRLFLLILNFIIMLSMKVESFFIFVPDKKDLVKANYPPLKDRLVKRIDSMFSNIESYIGKQTEELIFYQIVIEHIKKNPNQIPFKIEAAQFWRLSKWFNRKLMKKGWDYKFSLDGDKRYLLIATSLYFSRQNQNKHDSIKN